MPLQPTDASRGRHPAERRRTAAHPLDTSAAADADAVAAALAVRGLGCSTTATRLAVALAPRGHRLVGGSTDRRSVATRTRPTQGAERLAVEHRVRAR